MKKIFLSLILLGSMCLTSCNQNGIARVWGGTLTIKLPKGQKLMEATWKNNSVWYLTEPMDSDYVPTIKTFHEDTNLGMMEGTVVFIESKD